MYRADGLPTGLQQASRRTVPRRLRGDRFLGIAVLVGALCVVTVPMTSDITAFDVLAVLMSPVAYSWARQNRKLRVFMMLAGVWAFAILISDQIHGVPLRATVNALVLPVMLFFCSAMLGWLARRGTRNLQGVLLGLVLSHIVYVNVSPSGYFTENPWKFGLALPVTLLALTLATFPKRAGKTLPVLILAASAVYSMFHDFRSMAGISLVAIIIIIALRRRPRRDRKFPMTKLFVGLLSLVFLSYWSYGLIASSGVLPYEAQAKYQAQVGQGNILVAARPELVGSAYAIGASPIIGLGTGGNLDSDVVRDALTTLHDSGAVVTRSEQARLFGGGVNSHSLLFTAWVGAGLLGALPWAYMIHLGLRAIVRRLPNGRLLPLTVFWALAMGWDILFSPYQPHLHLLLAGFVAFMTWKDPRPQMAGAGPREPGTSNTTLRQ